MYQVPHSRLCQYTVRIRRTAQPRRVRTFGTAENLRRALLEFCETYSVAWLIERHGFRLPAAIRAEQLPPAAPAA